ncbi:MAG: nuclear transport factor 2 family protein [Thermoanaerobaculia bacterium]
MNRPRMPEKKSPGSGVKSRRACRWTVAAAALLVAGLSGAFADPVGDKAAVGALDLTYQAAVKVNDAATMDVILHDDFVLVIGVGKIFNKKDLLDGARNQDATYTHQEEIPGTQVVRLYGDTAIVTAKLWIAGRNKGGGDAFDYKLWFSDTYVRTPAGWRYAFGQAAQRLPPGS